jgi:hypothetical protein
MAKVAPDSLLFVSEQNHLTIIQLSSTTAQAEQIFTSVHAEDTNAIP